jgi:glycosyltransferase involved in cell wall biosynthesis
MVTVIIAHKDYNDYLQLAINSCLGQTIPVNYIVVDDGSKNPPNPPDWPITKDGDYKVYELDSNKFVYLPKSQGPSMARNIGIFESWENTTHFQILDADDIMLPNKCEILLNNFDNNTGVVYADYFIESNNIIKMEFKIPYTQSELNQHCIVHSGSMISKRVLEMVCENNCFYDPQLRVAEDYDLFLRCSEKAMIKHVPEFLTIVREHSLNSTYSVQNEVWQSCLSRVQQKRYMRNA